MMFDITVTMLKMGESAGVRGRVVSVVVLTVISYSSPSMIIVVGIVGCRHSVAIMSKVLMCV